MARRDPIQVSQIGLHAKAKNHELSRAVQRRGRAATSRSPELLVPEGFDRVHHRRPLRGVQAEEDADPDRDPEGQRDRLGVTTGS